MLGVITLTGLATYALILAAKKIKDLHSAQIERWQNSKMQVQQEMNLSVVKISQCLSDANSLLRFQELHQQYYHSRQLADKAYALLQSAFSVKKDLIDSICMVKNEIARVKELKCNSFNVRKRKKINLELKALFECKKDLYAQLQYLNLELSEYLSKLKEFNAQTHNLKLAIRDTCGKGGRIWYERLQARIKTTNNHKPIR